MRKSLCFMTVIVFGHNKQLMPTIQYALPLYSFFFGSMEITGILARFHSAAYF